MAMPQDLPDVVGEWIKESEPVVAEFALPDLIHKTSGYHEWGSPIEFKQEHLDWAKSIRSLRTRNLRIHEWYLECLAFGSEFLQNVVEINPQKAAGVPVLKGTRF